MAVVSKAIHIFRKKYPPAIDNRFIYSLLDKDFCAVQKKKTFKTRHEFSDWNTLSVDKTRTIHGLRTK